MQQGKDALHDIAEQWRYGGARIEETSHRREAYNLMLSMPAGTNAQCVLRAAREFAKAELADHCYVMALHEHQANPHVHLSVRAEGRHGQRLNPRKADLHRWRETFAERLRGWGIEAEASRQATRGVRRSYDPIWRLEAREHGAERTLRASAKPGSRADRTGHDAINAWSEIARALSASSDAGDRALALDIARFVSEMSQVKALLGERHRDARMPTPDATRDQHKPEGPSR